LGLISALWDWQHALQSGHLLQGKDGYACVWYHGGSHAWHCLFEGDIQKKLKGTASTTDKNIQVCHPIPNSCYGGTQHEQ
jgi:hypothetical protein